MARLSDPQFPMVKKKKKKRPATYSRSKITKAKAKQPRNNTISMSPAEESNTEPVQYYVTEFVDLRLKEYDPKCKRDMILVKWADTGSMKWPPTWEPLENIRLDLPTEVDEYISDYHKQMELCQDPSSPFVKATKNIKRSEQTQPPEPKASAAEVTITKVQENTDDEREFLNVGEKVMVDTRAGFDQDKLREDAAGEWDVTRSLIEIAA